MKVFSLEIQSPSAGIERLENIVSFTGADRTGSFSILAYAERRMTVLVPGLASFRILNGAQEFLAHAGGLLYFRHNELILTTQNYVRDSSYEKTAAALENEIKKNELAMQETRRSLRRLDEEIMRRLSHFNAKGDL